MLEKEITSSKELCICVTKATHSPKKNYDYRNSWNLIETTIIVIISKSGQGKTDNECEAGKNAS